jgi:hypothetical protein
MRRAMAPGLAPGLARALVLASVLVAVLSGSARAEQLATRIALTAEGGAHRVGVHPAYVTVLDFPSPIVRVVRSDATHFTIEATDRRVFLRPLQEATPGTVANLHVITEQALVTVLLHVTDEPADAATHIVFTTEPVRAPAPGRARLSLSTAALLGSVALDGGHHLVMGGLEAGLAYPWRPRHSLLAVATLARAWYTPLSDAPPGNSIAMSEDVGIATVQAVRVLGGYRVHRGRRWRTHATLLGGVQRWWVNEAARRLDPVPGEATLIESWRSQTHTDGITGVDVGLGIDLWRRWHTGLGVRALYSWRVAAPAFESVEALVSLQWR